MDENREIEAMGPGNPTDQPLTPEELESLKEAENGPA